MRTRAMLLAAATTLAGAGLAATLAMGTPATAVTNCDTSEAGLNAAEQEFLRLLNEERARVGAGPLAPSESLNRAAAWKSEDPSALPPNFSHTDSLGRTTSKRLPDCGYPYWGGENIAYGFSSAASVFDAWKASPGHYNNMIDPRFRVVGIGQHGWSWTNTFGTIDDSGAPRPTATATPTLTATPTRTATPSPTPGLRAIRVPGVARD